MTRYEPHLTRLVESALSAPDEHRVRDWDPELYNPVIVGTPKLVSGITTN